MHDLFKRVLNELELLIMSTDKSGLSWTLLIICLVSSWLRIIDLFGLVSFSSHAPRLRSSTRAYPAISKLLSVFSCCGKSRGHFSPWLFFIHALLVLLLFGGGALFVLSRFIVVSLDSADVNLLYSDHFDEQIDFFKSFLSNSVSV